MHITARQAYINVLTELVKEEAPTLYLEDFLYYINKAISEYMKSRYEMFELNQQLADDMRVWKKTFISTSLTTPVNNIFQSKVVAGKTLIFAHYRHLLSCVIEVYISRPITKCDQRAGTEELYKVTRMSPEIKAGLLGNKYLEATFYRPYYEIMDNNIIVSIGKVEASRVAVKSVRIEYLCQPEKVILTEDEIEADEDTSQVLEFPYEVGEEITKVALKLILERGSNPRLQSNVMVNQSISDITTGMKGGK